MSGDASKPISVGDTVLYSDGNVEVRNTLVKVGSVTYPVNGIGAVWVAEGEPISQVGKFLAVVICAVIGTVSLLTKDGLVFAILFYMLAAAIFYYARQHRNDKHPSELSIRTASGNQQLLKTLDVDHLNKIKRAIEQAVTLRG